jgi:large conductance mechanosensitive channel
MPPLGLLIGGVDVKDLALVLKGATVTEAGEKVAAVTLNYGLFLQNVVDFTFIAFVIFVSIKAINSLKRKEEVPESPPPPSATEKLLEEIRDLLKK